MKNDDNDDNDITMITMQNITVENARKGSLRLITIHEAAFADKSKMRNLLELYKYDFSEFDPEDDVNENGLYEYRYLDHYWTEDGRYPFLLRVDGKLAGLALIRRLHYPGHESAYEMAEFFVLKKYRRTGMGQLAAKELFDRFPGTWKVAVMESNLPAKLFWQKIIAQYAQSNYRETREEDWEGPVFIFSSGTARE